MFGDWGCNWGFFGVKDLLGRTGETRGGVCLGSAVSSVVPDLPASETPSFLHTFSLFLGRELLESNGIDFHCIWVKGSSRGRGVRGSEVGILCTSL